VNKFIVYYLHPEARYAVTVLSPGKTHEGFGRLQSLVVGARARMTSPSCAKRIMVAAVTQRWAPSRCQGRSRTGRQRSRWSWWGFCRAEAAGPEATRYPSRRSGAANDGAPADDLFGPAAHLSRRERGVRSAAPVRDPAPRIRRAGRPNSKNGDLALATRSPCEWIFRRRPTCPAPRNGASSQPRPVGPVPYSRARICGRHLCPQQYRSGAPTVIWPPMGVPSQH